MKTWKISLKIGFVLCLTLLVLIPCLYANITNEGNQSIRVEIERKSGFSRIVTLNPGQSVSLPKDATRVNIPPPSLSVWGDQVVNVTIVNADGTVTSLARFGASHEFNKEEDFGASKKVVLTAGKVVNSGNIPVQIIIYRPKGITEKRLVYVGQPISIPKDTVIVETSDDTPLRGDEIIDISVTMPNGTTKSIVRLGGRVTLQDSSF